MVACIAQFWPGKHPKNFVLCIVCVSLYAILSLALTFLTLLIEKDIIVSTKPQQDEPSLVIRSSMPRFQDKYTLKVAFKAAGAREAMLSKSVGEYFDVDGFVIAKTLKKDFKSLISQAMSGHATTGAEENDSPKKRK